MYVEPFIAAQLRPHQREGVRFMFRCLAGMQKEGFSGCILCDGMGLGKVGGRASLPTTHHMPHAITHRMPHAITHHTSHATCQHTSLAFTEDAALPPHLAQAHAITQHAQAITLTCAV